LQNNNKCLKAIAVAQKAAQEDQAGNYEEAIRSYKHAAKYFLHILNREPQGKDGNQKIREKCKEYLDRAEELHEYLEYKEVDTDLCLLCKCINNYRHRGLFNHPDSF
uniref:vesicle-fusing ATPase n=1 Tax=Hippocampus comes TaxID=109280 RepID=A0A3Q2XFH8_HIPCM